uniref:Uncharacterized protein n=1 Tax=Oryza brachyantha TaxID=4533 RepID=J3KZX7_ORYBR
SEQELLSCVSRISPKASPPSHLIRYGEARVLTRKAAFCMDKEHLKEGRDSSRQSGNQEICYVAAYNLLGKRKEQCYTW